MGDAILRAATSGILGLRLRYWINHRTKKHIRVASTDWVSRLQSSCQPFCYPVVIQTPPSPLSPACKPSNQHSAMF